MIFNTSIVGQIDETTDVSHILSQAYSDEKIDYDWISEEEAAAVRAGKSFVQGRIEHTRGGVHTIFLIFNPAHAPFDDVHFRRAIVAASDIEAMFGLHPLPWERRLVPSSITVEGSTLESSGFDPQTALSELEQSKYTDDLADFEVHFIRDTFGTYTDYYSEMLQGWDKILGFSVDLSHTEHPTEFADLLHFGELRIRDFEVDVAYPDPHAVLRAFISPFGEENSSKELEVVEAMLAEAAAEQDAAERRSKYEAIEAHILDQALALPILSSGAEFEILVQDYVHGFKIPQYPGSAFYDVWLDETAPERALP